MSAKIWRDATDELWQGTSEGKNFKSMDEVPFLHLLEHVIYYFRSTRDTHNYNPLRQITLRQRAIFRENNFLTTFHEKKLLSLG